MFRTFLTAIFLLAPLERAFAQPEQTAWSILHEGLGDKNPDRRRQVVAALGSIGLDPEAIKMIEHGLRDDESFVRLTAATVLGQMKSTASIPALKAALDDPSGEVEFAAARALWEMGDRSGEEVIQDVLSGQNKTSAGMIDGAVKDAKAKLRDKRGLVRIGIKEASGAILGPFSFGVTVVEDAMKDTGATGRILSALTLSQKCTDRNLQLLEYSLKEDKNRAVKAADAKAIGICGNKDDIPRLEGFLSSSNDALKFMSAATIIKLSGSR